MPEHRAAASPTVDVVVLVPGDRVVLVRRKYPPPGWALPGGFVDVGETLEAAAVREAREETGLDVELVDLLYVYSDPRRDPRRHTMSAVFVARAVGRADAAPTTPRRRAPSPGTRSPPPLAFDHAEILRDARTLPPHRRAAPAMSALSATERAALLGIARGAILAAPRARAAPRRSPPPARSREPRGAFVTLHVGERAARLRRHVPAGGLARRRPSRAWRSRPRRRTRASRRSARTRSPTSRVAVSVLSPPHRLDDRAR